MVRGRVLAANEIRSFAGVTISINLNPMSSVAQILLGLFFMLLLMKIMPSVSTINLPKLATFLIPGAPKSKASYLRIPNAA